jgi:hypothetical protein
MIVITAVAYADTEDQKVVAMGNTHEQALVALIDGINADLIDTANYELKVEEEEGEDETK